MGSIRETVIAPKRISDFINFAQVLRYKDLFVQLTLRDIKIRHKQTLLGVAWVIFQPFLSALIFTILFGIIIKIPSEGLPYPLFVFIGLTFWNFFATSLTSASGSLTGSESLVKKVYFPREILPLSTIATNLFDFVLSVVLLSAMAAFYRVSPHPAIFILFPLSVILVLAASVGSGLFLAASNVKYRDVRVVLPFFIQILIFVTPVFYPISIISPQKRWILALNPVTSAIEINRSLVAGQLILPFNNILISIVAALVILFIGVWYFRRTEGQFADVI